MSASISFFRHLLTPALITVTPPSTVLLRLASDPPPDIALRTGAELCEIIVLAIENGHRQQQMALVRDAYKYLVALHHLPAGTTVDLWWNRLCAVHDSTEFKKAVFIVAALLREDDTLLLQYIRDQFFPVSYLRHCLLDFVQRQGDQVVALFRQAKYRWEALGRPLSLAEFDALYDSLDVTPQHRTRSSRRVGKRPLEPVTDDPYQLLQVPRHASKIDVHKACDRRMRQSARELMTLTDRNEEEANNILLAWETIIRQKQTRPPCTANQQDGTLELVTRHNNTIKKRKTRQGPAVRYVPVVLCDVCKQDCVSDDMDTRLCREKRCLTECHVNCIPSRTSSCWTWCCSQCVTKGELTASVVPTVVDDDTSAQLNQAATSTADGPQREVMSLLEGVEKERDQPISTDEMSAETRRLCLLSVHIEEGLPIDPRGVQQGSTDVVPTGI